MVVPRPASSGLDGRRAPVCASPRPRGRRSAAGPVRNSASVRSAPVRSVPRRSAPSRSAVRRSAPRRSAPMRSAPRRSAALNRSPRRSRPARSRPRSSRPPRPSRTAVLTRPRRSPMSRRRSSTSRAASRPRSAPESPASRATAAVDLLGEVGGEVTGRRVGEVPPHLVHGPHRVERREHRPRDVVPVPPRATAEGDLDDLLSGAEAVEHLTPREALGPEAIVDRAAVVVAEVTARHTGRLVDREVGRPCERQCDTTESGASAAVGPELRASVHGVARHPRRLRR